MKLDAFNRRVDVFLKDLRSPAARSARLAKFAQEGIDEIRASNKRITGRDPAPRVTVDGRAGAPLSSVRPDGVIVANFDLVREVLEWIGEELLKASPVLTGTYRRSHKLYAGGREVPLDGTIPADSVYEFVNWQPYARKIEPRTSIKWYRNKRTKETRRTEFRTGAGQSLQAPDGVYAVVAVMAATRFGNVARVTYQVDNWEHFNEETGVSHPSIKVVPF